MTDSLQQTNWNAQARAEQVASLKASQDVWDLIVVGGGITGAGVFQEASARGLKVLLVEQQDFAWGTSSRSSKMVHGGLRYLGKGQINLARDSVRERQKLLDELKGLVDPLPFMMGHYRKMFPGPWVFDKLLAVYDFLAGRKQRRFISNAIDEFWVPGITQDKLKGVTQFADAVVDDSRLVMRVIHEGKKQNGKAINYLKALEPIKHGERVRGLILEDQVTGKRIEVAARAVINATGAWTDELRGCLGREKVIRPLRGSHLVVPFYRFPVSFSVSFFHPEDKRPVFAFPWEGTTVVGTTDLDHKGGLAREATISQSELKYLLDGANQQFDGLSLKASDVIATWAGVRPVVVEANPLASDEQTKPSDETREHAIWDDNGLISIAGGKLTTYRLLALEVLREATAYLGSSLKLEDLADTTHFEEPKEVFNPSCLRQLSAEEQRRLIGRFGKSANQILFAENFQKIATTDTFWAELHWSCQYESVVHLDDLLLRRSRVGLLLPKGGAEHEADIRAICQQALGWSDKQWLEEWARYQTIIQDHYSLPTEHSQ